MSTYSSNPGQYYRENLRVREGLKNFSVPDETWLQRVWFEELYQSELKTLDGETIHILQPGFWNKSAGPDFFNACLINAAGEREIGAVEIHCRPQDWHAHDHEKNENYKDVVLHIFWECGSKEYFPKKPGAKAVRQVELKNQLRVPLESIQAAWSASDDELAVGARMGLCRRHVENLRDEEISQLLYDAGWYRFRKKESAWRVRKAAMGYDQALWLGVAESLGYAKNKEAFRFLAQRLPITELKKQSVASNREALLFGLAGFLPERVLSPDKEEAEWPRTLWDIWWMERAEKMDLVLPKKCWNMAGLRPMNRPERRLAVLCLLASDWKRFSKLAAQGEPEALIDYLTKLDHSFWSHHYTLKSKPIAQKAQLLGEGRIQALLFNVIWPLGNFEITKLSPWLSKQKTSEVNKSAKIAAVRLLQSRALKKTCQTLLGSEGLIQIYQDFCAQDISHCKECPFPKQISQWKSLKSLKDGF